MFLCFCKIAALISVMVDSKSVIVAVINFRNKDSLARLSKILVNLSGISWDLHILRIELVVSQKTYYRMTDFPSIVSFLKNF